MKRRYKLIIIGFLFLLLLQVQASGQEQTRWNSIWPLSMMPGYGTNDSGSGNNPAGAPEANQDQQQKKGTLEHAKPQLVIPVVPAAKTITPSQAETPAAPNAPGGTKEPGASTSKNQIAELYKEFNGTLFRSGPSDSKKIALTFDDGPTEVSSNQVLDILKNNDIKATFFLLGPNVLKYPQVVKRMVEEGHVVAGHSWSHPRLDKLLPEAIAKEIALTEQAIFQVTGYNIALFRPPYGSINREALNLLKQSGYTVVNWSVDSLDWKYPDNLDKVRNSTLKDVKGGAILLFHTTAGKNPSKVIGNLLPELIRTLQSRGYQFVTVDEVLSVPAYK